jgi:hypothetical protein
MPLLPFRWKDAPGLFWGPRFESKQMINSYLITFLGVHAFGNEVARQININHASELIDQVIDAVSQWKQLAKQYPIPTDIIDHIQSTHRY